MKPKSFSTSEEAYHVARLLSERGYAPTVQSRGLKFLVISAAGPKIWHEVIKKFEWQRSLRKHSARQLAATQDKLI